MDYMNGGMYQQNNEEEKGNGFRIWFLIGAAVILVAVIIIGAVLLVSNNGKQKYVAAVNSANDYFDAGDYYNAVTYYEQAIAMDASKESNYLNLSTAYMMLGQLENARSVIMQGIENIDSESLRLRLQEIENGTFVGVAVNISEEEISAVSEGVTVENTTFDMVAAYTYTEYCRDYGTQVSASTMSDRVSMHYAGADFTAVYYNFDNEVVLNSNKTAPIATAKPCYVSFSNVRRLFSSSEEVFAVSFSKLQEILGGDVELTYDENMSKYLVTAKHKGCLLTIETDDKGNVVSENAWNKLEPLSRVGLSVDEEAEGEVSGYVQDAVTGKGMVATIKVRTRGSRNGEVLGELFSGKDGSYTFAGAHGVYTLEVSASGYITEYIDAEIIRGQVKTGKNVVLSPMVGEGEIRIVLTWGNSPSDLDSHAEGRSSTGSNFHIYFSNKRANNVGQLDVDDTNGFGPETITITDAGANFTYSVVDFTGSSAIGSSNAMVKVYLPGSTQAIVYTVPAGSGNNWEVFRYENGEVTPINTIN